MDQDVQIEIYDAAREDDGTPVRLRLVRTPPQECIVRDHDSGDALEPVEDGRLYRDAQGRLYRIARRLA